MPDTIYTHDEAMLIVELFENVLIAHGICVPSPEDNERDAEDMIGLYGSTYSELLELVEGHLVQMLDRHCLSTRVIEDEFSGMV